MENKTCRKEALIASLAFMFISGAVISEWIMVRVVLYRSQNSILSPADYEVEVIGADDYRKLADPNARTVTLSTGKTILNRSDTWSRLVFSKFKATNNGEQYVLVTTKGTAHFARRWDTLVIMVLPLALIGLLCASRCKKSS